MATDPPDFDPLPPDGDPFWPLFAGVVLATLAVCVAAVLWR